MTEKATSELTNPINISERIDRDVLPRIFQHVLVSFLKNNKTFNKEFIKKIRSLHFTAERLHKATLELVPPEESHRTEIDCKPGCYWCCGLQVLATQPELHLIFNTLRETWRPQNLMRLKADLRRFVEKISKTETMQQRLTIYCGFLKEGKCTIYDIRPFACRAWNSRDVEVCRTFVAASKLDFPSSICHYAPFDIMKRAIIKAMEITGVNPTMEELNAGILNLLENSRDGPPITGSAKRTVRSSI